MNEQMVRDLLDDLARTPRSPSRVDVHQAVSAGRRRLRVRRMTSAGAALVLVCALGGGAVVVMSSLKGSSQPATGTAPPTAQSRPPSSAAHLTGPGSFEPTVGFASFGWLPDGFTDRLMGNSWWGVSGVATAPGVGPKEKPTEIALTVQLAGQPPREEQFRVPNPNRVGPPPPPATDAPDVNGARARWYDDHTLYWEFAPNTWAGLYYHSVNPPADVRDILLRVARSVRLWGTEAQRFPLQVTGIPAGLNLVGASVETDPPSGSWWGRLTFSDGPGMTNQDGTPRFLSVEVGPDPERERITQWHITGPNTKVDGHPAYLGPAKDGSQTNLLHIFDVNGVAITVQSGDPAIAAILGPDGLIGVYHHTTTLPNQATWTDRPVR